MAVPAFCAEGGRTALGQEQIFQAIADPLAGRRSDCYEEV
jgi:hypothetical protein